MFRYASIIPGSIPNKLVVRVPAGQTITAIDHSCDGSAAVLSLELGATSNDNDASNLNLGAYAIINGGGHQPWNGALKTEGADVYVKGWMRSVAVGGSHNLVVFTETT